MKESVFHGSFVIFFRIAISPNISKDNFLQPLKMWHWPFKAFKKIAWSTAKKHYFFRLASEKGHYYLSCETRSYVIIFYEMKSCEIYCARTSTQINSKRRKYTVTGLLEASICEFLFVKYMECKAVSEFWWRQSKCEIIPKDYFFLPSLSNKNISEKRNCLTGVWRDHFAPLFLYSPFENQGRILKCLDIKFLS